MLVRQTGNYRITNQQSRVTSDCHTMTVFIMRIKPADNWKLWQGSNLHGTIDLQ